MSSPLRLDIFETTESPEGPALLMPEQIEDLRLSAFERGYVAGFEDAGRQTATDEAAARARVMAAIEALDFGYCEARAHCLSALEPVIAAMLETLLPAVARAAIVPMAVDALMPLASSRLDAPIILRVGPGMRPAFAAAFEGLVLPPLNIVETAEMDPRQAEIRSGDQEDLIDLSAAIARIAAAIADHYQPSTQERLHV